MLDPAQLAPCPPQWALDAGLPAPRADDTLESYVLALDLDPYDLVRGLTEQTAALIPLRLECAISKVVPEQWLLYLKRRCSGKEPTPEIVEVLRRQARARASRHP